MPLYVYVCAQCGARMEKLRPRAAADDPLDCPHCGSSRTRRAITAAASLGRESAAPSTAPRCSPFT